VATTAHYMPPTARIGAVALMQETFFISIGIAFYHGCNSRTDSVSGQRWLPYLPVANNGSFIVDMNKTF